ncbi:MAG: VOC family protein [Rhodobacteraceae bacterium]|nr:VOC family protein [Paracoccaceae bacterium]
MSSTAENALVWAEIPTTDMDRAIKFYSAVTGAELKLDESGPNPIAAIPVDGTGIAASGHIYPGTPAPRGAGPTIHLAVKGGLEQTLGRVAAAGGQVLSEPITIPAGRFAYTLDPDGNSIGFFERL